MGKIHTFELCDYQPEQHDQPYRYLVISQGQVLSTTAADLTLHSHADVHCRWPELTSQTETVFIGIANRNIPCFVIELAQPVEPEANHWLSPRALMANASADEYVALSRALQLGVWAREHRYCGVCGAPTRQHQTERAMFCEPCNKLYFPRIAPCIITIVTRGEYCLLAHHSRYKVNSYSTLAGFIVVGFIAHYDSGDIVIDDDEISDAQWFHYTRLPETPPPLSISGQLIQTFVDRCRQAQ